MPDVLLDAFLDSLKVLGVAFILYVILSFFESKLSRAIEKSKKMSPLFGSLVGMIPQCGFSVVASDLYIKRRITLGTLFAIFIACSDEAIPILASDIKSAKYIIPLILIKFVAGFILGVIVDLIIRKREEKLELEGKIHIGCCHHEIDNEDEEPLHQHLIHPLTHSLKIFAYVFIINIIFGTIIYFIGEDNIISFLQSNKYLSPVLASIIGLIPNCASSVLVTELYLLGGIPFGACVAGLSVNAGLGLVVLFKNKSHIKKALLIMATMFIYSILIGYLIILITSLIM